MEVSSFRLGFEKKEVRYCLFLETDHSLLYSLSYEGTSFVISLIDRLIIEVLPQLFFHQSMAAFTRQLNVSFVFLNSETPPLSLEGLLIIFCTLL